MEWLPGNKEYDLAGKYNIEWYSADGDRTAPTTSPLSGFPLSRKSKILSRHKKTAADAQNGRVSPILCRFPDKTVPKFRQPSCRLPQALWRPLDSCPRRAHSRAS